MRKSTRNALKVLIILSYGLLIGLSLMLVSWVMSKVPHLYYLPIGVFIILVVVYRNREQFLSWFKSEKIFEYRGKIDE